MFEHLLPFVRDTQLPVTVYVATSQIETGQAYWFDRVMNALQGAGETRIDMRAAGLGQWVVGPMRGKARWSQIGDILAALKAAPAADRDRLADEIIAQTPAIGSDFTPLTPMSIAQLQELAADPLVTIGAHSHCHNLLDQIPLEEARASIAKSRKLLEGWIGQPVAHFAYPNGNYTPELMDAIRDLGFSSATSLDERLATQDAPKMALPRISVGRYDVLSRFLLRLTNV